jgi:hypothetical protein
MSPEYGFPLIFEQFYFNVWRQELLHTYFCRLFKDISSIDTIWNRMVKLHRI